MNERRIRNRQATTTITDHSSMRVWVDDTIFNQYMFGHNSNLLTKAPFGCTPVYFSDFSIN